MGTEQPEKKSLSAVLNLEVTALLTNSEVCGIAVQILADTNGLSCGVKNKLCSCLFFQLFYLLRNGD